MNRQINFLMTGTSNFSSQENPFLRALSERLPGKSVFFQKREWGTIDKNYERAKRQLLDAIRLQKPDRVVVIGHSEGGIYAMKLAELDAVHLGVVCGTAICAFRDAMRYQFASPVAQRTADEKRRLIKALKSKAFVSPSPLPGPADREAFQRFFDIMPGGARLRADPALLECCVAYLSYDGARLISAANQEKLLFFFAKQDLTTPVDLSIRNIRQVSQSIPIKRVEAFHHCFLTKNTKKNKVSQVAIRQMVRLICPNHRVHATRCPRA